MIWKQNMPMFLRKNSKFAFLTSQALNFCHQHTGEQFTEYSITQVCFLFHQLLQCWNILKSIANRHEYCLKVKKWLSFLRNPGLPPKSVIYRNSKKLILKVIHNCDSARA